MTGFGPSQPVALPEAVTRAHVEPWIAKEIAGDHVERVAWPTSPDFDEIEHPSKILRERSLPSHGIGDLHDDTLLNDGFLGALYGKYFDGILSLERIIDPGADTPRAKETAALCRWSLRRLKGRAIIYRHMLGARPRGVAIVENIWGRINSGAWRGASVPVEQRDRPMRRFAFRRGDRALAVRHATGERRFVIAPPGKFVVVQRGSLDTPWGNGELEALYWPSWMTQHGAAYWALAVQRYADPIPEVKYPWRAGADKANGAYQKVAAATLDALRRGKGVSIPQDLEAQLLEVTSSGGLSYTEYMAYWNRIKANRILAEIRTSGLHQGHGSFAAENVSASLFAGNVKLGAADFADDVTEEILAPITQANFGPDTPVPRLRIEISDADDRRLLMQGLELAREFNLDDVPETHVYRVLGVPRTQPGEKAMAWPDEDSPASDPRQDSPSPTPRTDLEASDLSSPLHLAAEEKATHEADQRWREMDALVDALRADFAGHWTEQRNRLEAAWDDGTLATGEAYARVFEPADSHSQAERLHAAYVHGLGYGLRQLDSEGLGPRLWRAEAPRDRPADLLLAAGTLQLNDQPSGAALTNGDAAATWWADVLGVPRDVFLGLDDALRRAAFTIAAVEDLRLLQAAHQLVSEAIAQGFDRKTFRAELERVYAEHGLGPTSDHHADLILQNAVAHATGAIRWQQTVGNPAAHRLVPFLRFSTIEDDRVRARRRHDHDVMSGRVFATSHRIWRTWWSPAGHGCRCWISLVLTAEARRLGLVGDEPSGPWPQDRHGGDQALPDPGFQGAAGRGAIDGVEEQLRTTLRRARAAGGAGESATRYLQALENLLRLLGLIGDDA